MSDDEHVGSGYTTRVLHVAGTVGDSTYPGYSTRDRWWRDRRYGRHRHNLGVSRERCGAALVELHFGEELDVDFATIHWAYNDYQGQYMTSQEVEVQMWDGSSYQTVATMNPGAFETETTITFAPVTTTRLRFYQLAGQGPATYTKVMWLTEIDYGLSP